MMWICGGILNSIYKGKDCAFCAKEDENLEKQIKSIVSLATTSSEAARNAEKIAGLCTNRNVIIIVGNSKAGKSTFVNLLIGNKLVAVRNQVKELVIVRAGGNNPSTGPDIGEKRGQPETSLPSAWNISNKFMSGNSDLLLDVPGFGDIRGPVQDITNAFYLYRILKKAKSARVVLVSDINEISHDSVKGFLDLIDTVHTIFAGSEEILKSASIIFSKCEPQHLENIEEYLRVVLNNPDIKNGKALIEHFVKMPGATGILRRPTKEGPIEISTTESAAQVLTTTKTVFLLGKKIFPSISSDSKVFLSNVSSILTDECKISPFTNSLKTFCDKQIRECKEAILSKDVERIVRVRNVLVQMQLTTPKPMGKVSEDNMLEALRALGSLDKSIAEAVDSISASSAIKFISFIDDLFMTGAKEQWFSSINQELSHIDFQLEHHIASANKILLQMRATPRENRIKGRREWLERYKKQIGEVLNDVDEKRTLTEVFSRITDLFIPGFGFLLNIISHMSAKELKKKLGEITEFLEEYIKLTNMIEEAANELETGILKAEFQLFQDLDVLRREKGPKLLTLENQKDLLEEIQKKYQIQIEIITTNLNGKMETLSPEMEVLKKKGELAFANK